MCFVFYFVYSFGLSIHVPRLLLFLEMKWYCRVVSREIAYRGNCLGESSGSTCTCRRSPPSRRPELGGATAACHAAGRARRPRRPRPPSRCPWWWCSSPSAGRCCVPRARSWTWGRRGSQRRPPPWISPPLQSPGSSRLRRTTTLLHYYSCSNILLHLYIKTITAICHGTCPCGLLSRALSESSSIWKQKAVTFLFYNHHDIQYVRRHNNTAFSPSMGRGGSARLP